MRNAKNWFAIGIIVVAMIAVLAVSGCVEETGNLAEDISEIGSKEYQETFIKGEKRPVAVDSEYSLLLKEVRDYTGTPCEAVVEIFSDFGNVSIGQKTLGVSVLSGGEVEIERLTLELIDVDSREGYAEIKISEKVDVAGYGEKTIGVIGDIAESFAKSQT